MGLQALRDLFQPTSQSTTGQTLPTSTDEGSTTTRSSSLAPANMTGGGFDLATLASLFSAQESGSTPGASLISQVDGNGDGAIDLEELGTALGTDSSALAETFGSIDSDGDGQVTETELDAGMKAMFEKNGPPAPPSEADMASSLLSMADTDEDNSLSLDEILAALGGDDEETETQSISDSFAAQDTDGDSSLSADELTAAIEAMIARTLSAYQTNVDGGGQSVSLAA